MKKITTSDSDFFKKMAKAYKKREDFLLEDDAGMGINPAYSTLLEMGKQAGLSPQQWLGVLASLGLSGAGVWLVRLAVLDPEPTSKLSLMVASGSVCILGGGVSAIAILIGRKPPSVSVGCHGFQVSW